MHFGKWEGSVFCGANTAVHLVWPAILPKNEPMNRILPALLAALAALTVLSGCSPSAEQDSITVAAAPFESVGLVHVAQAQDMFAEHDLRVKYREYSTGVDALEAVIKGEADIAVGASEFPLVARAFKSVPISAIATIDRPDFIYLIGRRDKGIEKPADLKGKRIGTLAGSIAQFYLGRFLELNGMTGKDVELVDLKTPEEWRAAIASGTVDAVVLAQPEASLVRSRLGDNAEFFSVQGKQPAFALAIATNKWIADNPGGVEAFLAALTDAEEFAEEHPAEARGIIQKRLGLDADYMNLVEAQNTFGLSLDQSLIVAMEDEARWMIRNKITTQTVVPDVTDYVHTAGLRAVRPEAVDILR